MKKNKIFSMGVALALGAGAAFTSCVDTDSNLVDLGPALDSPNDTVYSLLGVLGKMQAVADLTRGYNVPTTVSLNSLMVDGLGMCGACRVTVGGQMKFTCVDGPEFDGHQVDFAELRSRLGSFRTQEAQAREHHRCNCFERKEA